VLKVINISATMARQEVWVQLELSDMCLVWNTADMAKEGCLQAAVEKTQYVIIYPCPVVWEEQKWCVEQPGNKQVKAAIQRHMAMLAQNHMPCCLSCNIVGLNCLQRLRRCSGTGAAPQDWHRQRNPAATPPLPALSPATTGNASREEPSHIIHVLARYPYSKLLFPRRNIELMMRIAITKPILIQICWLMNAHSVVSTLSVVS
jgi:hypothetical protein